MSSTDEQVLRAAKEIMVKFIETGRISPTAFPETFRLVYDAIRETVQNPQNTALKAQPSPPSQKS